MEAIWDNTLLEDVLKVRPNQKTMISVSETDSLNSTLEKMLKFKISSVPVMKHTRFEDSSSSSGARDYISCVGIVDVKDVVQFLVRELEYIEGWTCWAPVQFKALMDGVNISDVMDLSKGDPLVVANVHSTLRSVVKFFASGVSHRCIVHIQDNDFAVLSQLDVMHYLAKRVTDEQDLLRLTLEGIPLMEKLSNRSCEAEQVVSCNLRETVVQVLKKMYGSEVSAVAIVDDDGKLQANFSSSDVLHLEIGALSDLNLPVEEYLKKYSMWSLNPLAVQKEDGSLADAVVLFSGLGVHRIWVVDSNVYERFSPIRVITLTDLFAMLMKV